jgi:glycosyltransferase involved in cell wall biosynthesis
MNKKGKKIGVIVTYPAKGEMHSDFSGIAGYTKNLLLGYNVDQREKIVVFSNIKNGEKIFVDENVEVNECWKRGDISFVKQIIENIKKYPDLELIHIQHEFNLFGGSFSILLYLFLLRKIKKLDKKIIVTYHGVVPQKIINKEFREISQLNLPVFLIKLFFIFIYTISRRYIDQIIVHENCFKNFLIKDYGFKEEKIEVIHHGIEDRELKISQQSARDSLKIGRDKRVVLFFGFLAGYKGIDLLLDAFELLDKDKYYLILAGGKPKRVEKNRVYNEWYKKIEARINNNDNILQTGFVLDKDIELYFSVADVVVLPYLQMLSASGPMSFALSFKKPFLASDVFREVLKNEKVIFERNEKSLKKVTEKFFEDQDFFDDYIKNKRSERMWKIVSKKTFKLYENIVRSA